MIGAIRRGFAGLGNPNRGVFFTLLGFGVRIHPTFWLVAFLIGLQRSASVAGLVEWVAVVLVSILVHELGHALTAGRWSVVYRISVHGAGGETTWRPLGEVTVWQRVAVSLAGPAAGFAVAGAAWPLQPYLPPHWVIRLAARDLVLVNLAWGVFNLLPIDPLDGGQALKAWLSERWYARGEWAASGIGVMASLAGLIAALLLAQPWAALVLGIYGIHNGQAFKGHYEAYRDAHTHTKWQKPLPPDQLRERY